MFLGLQAKLYAFGAGLLAVLALILRMQVLKNGRDNARMERDVLKARVHVQKVNSKIKREEKVKLSSRRAELKKELSQAKEDFEGVDNFNKPNDF